MRLIQEWGGRRLGWFGRVRHVRWRRPGRPLGDQGGRPFRAKSDGGRSGRAREWESVANRVRLASHSGTTADRCVSHREAMKPRHCLDMGNASNATDFGTRPGSRACSADADLRLTKRQRGSKLWKLRLAPSLSRSLTCRSRRLSKRGYRSERRLRLLETPPGPGRGRPAPRTPPMS
jgi:hypothetical protein